MEYFQAAYLSENTIGFGVFNNNPDVVFKTYRSDNCILKKKIERELKKRKRKNLFHAIAGKIIQASRRT